MLTSLTPCPSLVKLKRYRYQLPTGTLGFHITQLMHIPSPVICLLDIVRRKQVLRFAELVAINWFLVGGDDCPSESNFFSPTSVRSTLEAAVNKSDSDWLKSLKI